MSRWIDTSGTYPVMRAKLPRLALKRYQQMLFEQGIYPLGGRVRALGKSGVSPHEAIGRQRHGPGIPTHDFRKDWFGGS